MSKHDVFLSYNKADKPAVDEIARQLVKAGIQPWLDEWNLIPGEPWQEAIEAALDSCATCAVFVGPSGTGPWQNEEMRAAIQRRVNERRTSERPFRVIPVLLPGAERGERSQLPSFLVATTWVEFRQTLDDDHASHRLVSGIRGIEPGPSPGQAIYEGQCPYRGLRFFDVQHAPFFFGREALTGWLLNELRPITGKPGTRFLAIIGASGSGKSSLARAGLVAALKRGEIEHSEQWPIYIIRPGSDPLESLAVALSSNISVALGLVKYLRNNERTLHLTTRLILRDAPQEQRVVVLVDQFEEIFTLCHDDRVRQAFIDNLLYATNVVQGQTVVLFTLRADFYGDCAMHPALAAALSDHQLLVGSMENDDLRHVIERPAQLSGCEFETGLVEILLRDVKDQPSNLPLLQHALLELWQQREGRRLSYEIYRAIGGVEGALRRRAEAVYEQFTESEKAICKHVFLRLTQPGERTEDTRRKATFQELLPVEGEHRLIKRVIHMLAEENTRLITIEGETSLTGEQLVFVEVVHEALIQGWSRLREWIEEDRAALRIHRKLTEATNEWTENVCDKSYLFRGTKLTEVEKWVKEHAGEMNTLEYEFVQASQDEREKEALEWEKQQRLDEENRQLKELDVMKSEFVATVSHDLRAPLTFIRGYATMLVMVGDLNKKQHDYLERILEGIDQMSALIGDLLNLRRIEAGVGIRQEPCRLGLILVEAVDAMRARATSKGVTLRLEPTEGAPTVAGDRTLLRQAVSNLVDNAIKYTPAPGQVSVGLGTTPHEAVIHISDTGIGIAPEDQVRLFEKYYHIKHRAPGNIQGTGLGLALVKSIIERHGGRVWVESVPNQGSTFYIALPLPEET